MEDKLTVGDLSEPRLIPLPPYSPEFIPRLPSPILVFGCEEAPTIPEWIIKRQVPDVPQFLVESKTLGLSGSFCLIKDPFTFRRYPGF